MKRYLYTHVHSSIIYNNQKVEAIHVCIHQWMGKQNVVHTVSEILFGLKKEGNSDTWHDMDEPWGHYAKWSKPDAKGQTVYDSTHMRSLWVKFMETEGRRVVARGWGVGRIESYCFIQSLILQDEKTLGDWLHNNVNVRSTPELDALKWLRW